MGYNQKKKFIVYFNIKLNQLWSNLNKINIISILNLCIWNIFHAASKYIFSMLTTGEDKGKMLPNPYS